MFGRWATTPTDAPETVITRTSTVTGTIRTDGDIRIYGSFEGDIETAGAVTIGRAARVSAQISAKDVIVIGTLAGNIHAMGRVEILAGGRVLGDIASVALRIEDGGLFSGRSIVLDTDLEALIQGSVARPVLQLPEG